MRPAFQATFWGFVSGRALVIGAAVGYFARVPGDVVADEMASGAVAGTAGGYLYDHHKTAQQKALAQAYQQGYEAGKKRQ